MTRTECGNARCSAATRVSIWTETTVRDGRGKRLGTLVGCYERRAAPASRRGRLLCRFNRADAARNPGENAVKVVNHSKARLGWRYWPTVYWYAFVRWIRVGCEDFGRPR